MNAQLTPTRAAALAVALSAILAVLTGCQAAGQTPAAPVYVGAVVFQTSPNAQGVKADGDVAADGQAQRNDTDADAEIPVTAAAVPSPAVGD